MNLDRRSIMRFAMLAVILTTIALAAFYRDRIDFAAMETWLKSFGILAPAIFIAAYVIATVAFLPGSILTLLGGALFGPWWGTLINVTAATLGATLALIAARYVASDWVRKKSGPRLRRLIDGVDAEGWRFVALCRLVPILPFNLLNYAFGMTRIAIVPYVVTTFICMIPAGFAYTYLGYAGREMMAGGEGYIQTGLLALGLIAAVAFLPRLVRRFRGKKSGP